MWNAQLLDIKKFETITMNCLLLPLFCTMHNETFLKEFKLIQLYTYQIGNGTNHLYLEIIILVLMANKKLFPWMYQSWSWYLQQVGKIILFCRIHKKWSFRFFCISLPYTWAYIRFELGIFCKRWITLKSWHLQSHIWIHNTLRKLQYTHVRCSTFRKEFS